MFNPLGATVGLLLLVTITVSAQRPSTQATPAATTSTFAPYDELTSASSLASVSGVDEVPRISAPTAATSQTTATTSTTDDSTSTSSQQQHQLNTTVESSSTTSLASSDAVDFSTNDDIDDVATTDPVSDRASHEPVAESRTQTEQDAWDAELAASVAAAADAWSSPDEAPVSLSATEPVPTAAEPEHVHQQSADDAGAQREAKTIVQEHDDDEYAEADATDGLSAGAEADEESPLASGLTHNKRPRAQTFADTNGNDDAEYQNGPAAPSTPALHQRFGFTDADDADDVSNTASSLHNYAHTDLAPRSSTMAGRPFFATSPAPAPQVTTSPTTTTTTTTTTTVPSTTTGAPAQSRRAKPKAAVETPPSSVGVDEILRRHVYESHVRSPMALLVDATPDVLQKTRALWTASLKPQPNLDVILMTFNMSGIGVTYKFNNTRTLFAGLDSLQDSRNGQGATFFGLVRVTRLIPYDSAIFVCTDQAPIDPNVHKYAAMSLLKKRIRVFLIWFGPPVPEGQIEGGDLGKLALQSGGDILRVTDEELGLIKLYEHNDVLKHDGDDGLLKRLRPTRDASEIDDDDTWTAFNTAQRSPRSQPIVQPDDLSGADPNDEDNIETLNEGEIARTDVIRFPDDPELNNGADVAATRQTQQAATAIQMGVQSQLLPSPGATALLYFEVRNLRDQATLYNFQVADELRYLQAMTPLSLWLSPFQTATVTVTTRVPTNAAVGSKDKITFTAQGVAGLATQSAQLTVSGGASGGAQQDTRQPTLRWTYGSRCDWKTGPGQCASAVWTLDITAQDTDTGLLRLGANPAAGLVVRTAFTAGTQGEVTATYTASCCVPKVTISAADLAGNQRTQTLDVRDLWLSDGAIAAVVVGVLLLLLLVALLVWLCVFCCRRRRESRDLELFRARSVVQQHQQQQEQRGDGGRSGGRSANDRQS